MYAHADSLSRPCAPTHAALRSQTDLDGGPACPTPTADDRGEQEDSEDDPRKVRTDEEGREEGRFYIGDVVGCTRMGWSELYVVERVVSKTKVCISPYNKFSVEPEQAMAPTSMLIRIKVRWW